MTNPLTDLVEFCFNHGGNLKSHRSFGELAQLAQRERDEHLSLIKELTFSRGSLNEVARKQGKVLLAKENK